MLKFVTGIYDFDENLETGSLLSVLKMLQQLWFQSQSANRFDTLDVEIFDR